MRGAPETAHNQNTEPQRHEPREILVEHLAPSSEKYDMKGKDTRFTLGCRARGHRESGQGKGQCFQQRVPPRIIHINDTVGELIFRLFVFHFRRNLADEQSPAPTGREEQAC